MLKINLHITEKCNYHCRYCFAHFDNHDDLMIGDWKRIIDNIKASKCIDTINFAGGEPVLYGDFEELVEYAYGCRMKLSIISNGSLLLNQKYMPEKLFAYFDTLGISVDSIRPKTLVELGACDSCKNILTYNKLELIIRLARFNNPNIKIKLNTVVNQLNKHEVVAGIDQRLHIDRWKFLKIKSFKKEDFSNEDLMIDDRSFDRFLQRNSSVRGEIIPERTMVQSYIMIDNRGNLVDNSGQNYQIIGNILQEDFKTVFQRYQFDQQSYNSRYSKGA